MAKLAKILGNDKALLVKPSLDIERIISWERAITLIMFRNAYTVLNREDDVVRAATAEFPKPLVVARSTYRNTAPRKFSSSDHVSKKTIRIRDDYVCQYCGDRGTTIDHIVPKSSGGLSTWGNMCVACIDCNQAKGSKTLAEVGFSVPKIPKELPLFRKTALQEALFEALKEGF